MLFSTIKPLKAHIYISSILCYELLKENLQIIFHLKEDTDHMHQSSALYLNVIDHGS